MKTQNVQKAKRIPDWLNKFAELTIIPAFDKSIRLTLLVEIKGLDTMNLFYLRVEIEGEDNLELELPTEEVLSAIKELQSAKIPALPEDVYALDGMGFKLQFFRGHARPQYTWHIFSPFGYDPLLDFSRKLDEWSGLNIFRTPLDNHFGESVLAKLRQVLKSDKN